MHMQQHEASVPTFGGVPPAASRPQMRLPRPPRRPYPGTSVPEAVVTCLAEARRPTQQEIEEVARRIWIEVGRGARPDRVLPSPQSPGYGRMIALARAALGLSRASLHAPEERP